MIARCGCTLKNVWTQSLKTDHIVGHISCETLNILDVRPIPIDPKNMILGAKLLSDERLHRIAPRNIEL